VKGGVLASSKIDTAPSTQLSHLAAGYRLCAKSEGKSQNYINLVTGSIRYLEQFLLSEGLTTDATQITAHEIRAFVLHLQRRRCFAAHPYSHPQERGLSSHTVNCYLRSIRAFWSWLSTFELTSLGGIVTIKH